MTLPILSGGVDFDLTREQRRWSWAVGGLNIQADNDEFKFYRRCNQPVTVRRLQAGSQSCYSLLVA